MIVRWIDFNGADEEIARDRARHWIELNGVMSEMPLHLKASEQNRIVGRPIFDPVGTNAYVKEQLVALGWAPLPIPALWSFFGLGIDLGKQGTVAEIQFSNYPFVVNNVMRTDMLHREGVELGGGRVGLLVLITKAHMFEASNSTLYYEQAVRQVEALQRSGITLPIRVVGLFAPVEEAVGAVWTQYAGRYSRTVVSQRMTTARMTPGRSTSSRCRAIVEP